MLQTVTRRSQPPTTQLVLLKSPIAFTILDECLLSYLEQYHVLYPPGVEKISKCLGANPTVIVEALERLARVHRVNVTLVRLVRSRDQGVVYRPINPAQK
jgi:hypothetical protein